MEQTLQAVQEQFTLWRQQKPYKRGRIPEELWESALSLISQHTPTEIIKTLQLNGGDFRRRLHGRSAGNAPAAERLEFVELDGLLEPQPSCAGWPCGQIELERPDGYRLRLISSGAEPLNGQAVLREFLQGNHAATCRSN